ncbi:MAG: DUF4169 family protein [Sphingomonas sp.]|uniref:DUF4169 family protein n=1 Tax=Sphingomonas sp. TaxID=28214 RepID=UPI0025E27321|nr:DUF4169 family protein [Sphingomonas sp.]MBX3565635.1 DUF4169 family protein [Sphingomonas sp.]
MGELVNLRQARKARDRKVRAATADANRVAFGRTKAERAADAAAKTRLDKTLDGARRED